MFDESEYYNAQPPEECHDFVMQQTMIRIKDPKPSLDFYIKGLGMTLLVTRHFPQWNFSLFFVGYYNQPLPADQNERWLIASKLPGCIELTHNYGTESQEGKVYNIGNSDGGIKGGFGHIGITVPDVYAACQRLKDLGAEFQKSPNSGGMKGLAFVKDPDGYWIEILSQQYPVPVQEVDCCGVSLTTGGTYTGGGGGASTAAPSTTAAK
eukprot:c244_g1_i1.p1 GENE.c244_g1_i1~~c244_g1_i1.p1  ORF type:complete len:209 (-),score=41.46 c244_g1_i1:29-655(-)